ncbi:hypothetical protein Pla123a_34300 [Posidoniimonas polymericola]|uniref:YcxB-like protein domain-containing protein n=1 Tax=Posidoniimonas polymericola TaxID=2528002 RepID=A0A5C5YIA9_9BACT|nr:hypothetical protein [Posidoniimonas polymericola]TWT74606.1 hypothetical protein Pla123a_34300 [Posidoniimonas polymericola]
MHLTANRKVIEQKTRSEALFRESSDAGMWLGLCVLLVLLAFYAESSVARGPEGLHVVIGGLVSWGGLVGVSALLVAHFRKARAYSGLARKGGSANVFVELSDSDLTYGLQNAWSKKIVWELVSRVDFSRDSLVCHCPFSVVHVSLSGFSASEIQELGDFLESTRGQLTRRRSFGLPDSHASQSYGMVKPNEQAM